MNQAGDRENSSVIPCFNRSIRIDFRGAKISSDTGILMLREIDQRFNITAPLADRIEDSRRASHLRHTYVDLIRQRVYQMAAGYEDCNDANHLRIDPAMRLALGKNEEYAALEKCTRDLEGDKSQISEVEGDFIRPPSGSVTAPAYKLLGVTVGQGVDEEASRCIDRSNRRWAGLLLGAA